MPVLSKNKQEKKEKKAASSISTALFSCPEPSYESEDDDERPRVVRPCETAEQAAARVAAYAAQGRNQWGVLLEAAPYLPICVPRRQKLYSDEECQQLVDLWGWHHGAELILERNEGWTLDDLYGCEMQVAWDEYCAVKQRLAGVLGEEDERAIVAMKQQHIAEKVAVESRRNLGRKDQVVKKNIPCSRLYSCEGDKSSGGAKPTTMYVSSECWSHERVCPKTGRLLTPHCCPWLHPGEEGWNPQWNRNRLWRPAAAPVAALPIDARWSDAQQRFAALGGKVVPPPPPPAPRASAWGARGPAAAPPPPPARKW